MPFARTTDDQGVTQTRWIPASSHFWVEHEAAFAEMQRVRARKRREEIERQFWRRYGLPGVHR